MNDEYRNKIVGALADEAIERDKKKGMIIDNLAGFRKYKVTRIEAHANEDPSWLIQQGDRMFGATQAPLGFRSCARCGAPLQPRVSLEYEGKDYCDLGCAEGTSHNISYAEFKANVKAKGFVTGKRLEIVDGQLELGEEFIVTYEDVLRNEGKKYIKEVERLEVEDDTRF
jgi:hypothetical protein